MAQNPLTTPVNNKKQVLIFIASLLVPLFWLLNQLVDVYRTAWLGAVFEILWLPMLLLLFMLPVLSLILWTRAKFSFRSLYFYSLIILVAGIVFLVASS
jgi:hypothetical protein